MTTTTKTRLAIARHAVTLLECGTHKAARGTDAEWSAHRAKLRAARAAVDTITISAAPE